MLTRWRATALMPLALLLSSAAPVPSIGQVNETGRVLAQLDDVRAIFFVLVVVIVLLLGLVLWVVKVLIGNLTRNLSDAVKQLALSLDGMTKTSSERATVELVHNARVEMVLSRVEAVLGRQDREDPHVG